MNDLPVSIINEGTKQIPIKKLTLFPGNARKGDVEKLANIIRGNGFIGYLVVNKRPGTKYGDLTVLAGNHTLQAAERAGMKSVPCVLIDVDDERALKINLAHNKASDDSLYDDTQLLMQLRDLINDSIDDINLNEIGYTVDQIEAIRVRVETPPDQKPKKSPKARILVQCTCEKCGNSWTGYIDEDATVQRVDQGRGRKRNE